MKSRVNSLPNYTIKNFSQVNFEDDKGLVPFRRKHSVSKLLEGKNVVMNTMPP